MSAAIIVSPYATIAALWSQVTVVFNRTKDTKTNNNPAVATTKPGAAAQRLTKVPSNTIKLAYVNNLSASG